MCLVVVYLTQCRMVGQQLRVQGGPGPKNHRPATPLRPVVLLNVVQGRGRGWPHAIELRVANRVGMVKLMMAGGAVVAAAIQGGWGMNALGRPVCSCGRCR